MRRNKITYIKDELGFTTYKVILSDYITSNEYFIIENQNTIIFGNYAYDKTIGWLYRKQKYFDRVFKGQFKKAYLQLGAYKLVIIN
jgi:hypothetical protein